MQHFSSLSARKPHLPLACPGIVRHVVWDGAQSKEGELGVEERGAGSMDDGEAVPYLGREAKMKQQFVITMERNRTLHLQYLQLRGYFPGMDWNLFRLQSQQSKSLKYSQCNYGMSKGKLYVSTWVISLN